jgi:hypothetical protein
VTQTQLSLLVVTLLEGFDELGEVKADAPRELGHGLALNAGNLLERIVDGATQLFVSHAQLHLALLLARGQVELQEVLEDIVHETLRDGVDVLESALGRDEGHKRLELNEPGETAEVLDGLLQLR